jgi:hypothetical protein
MLPDRNVCTGFEVLAGVVKGRSNLWDSTLQVHIQLTYYWTTDAV